MAAHNIADLFETQIFPGYGQMAPQLQIIRKLTKNFSLENMSFSYLVPEKEKLYADWLDLHATNNEWLNQQQGA